MSSPINSSQWMYASGGFYGHEIENSLRFNDGDSAKLAITPGSASNRRTFTFSSWVKRSTITADGALFACGANAQNRTQIYFLSNDKLGVYSNTSNSDKIYAYTDALFRDTSAWYNVVVAIDTTDGTAGNRLKMYVNGVLQSYTYDTTPSQNDDFNINNNVAHAIGSDAYAGQNLFDGYLADVNFIDGTALTAASFGETKDGVWVPKDTGGLTFGTNGFRLEFKQTGTSQNASGIGADTSGETNHLSVTNLVAGDVTTDSPTNNFCTFNPLDTYNYTLSEGNLKAVNSTNNRTVRATTLLESGKWYWELRRHNTANSDGNIYILVGVAKNGTNIQDNPYTSAGNYTYTSHTGVKYNNNTSASYGDNWRDAGDIVGIAFDADNGAIWFSKNGTWQNSATTSEITAGTTTNAAYTGLTDLAGYIPIFARTGGTAANEMDVNFGQNPSFNAELTGGDIGTESGDGGALFKYAPPSGFKAICSSNFTDPAIGPNQDAQADDNFNTVLYTGNGSDGRSITGVGFDPDWIWIKSRNKTTSHLLNDTIRGANKSLFSEGTNAETAGNGGGYLSAFVTDGFSVTSGSSGDDAVNDGSGTYVAWNWKAGGSASSNSDGSNITSSVSANTDAGFSIVSYTGSGTGSHTVGHGLTQKPDLVIVKNRDGDSSPNYWHINHKDLAAADNNIFLNLSSAASDVNTNYAEGGIGLGDANVIDFVAGYSGANNVANANKSGSDYIAYCFHSVEGYSKFGTYKGNAAADGAFVYTGFKPAWLMCKNLDQAGSWIMFDNKREGYNFNNHHVMADTTAAEADDSDIDLVSNGFKCRRSSTSFNSADDFIYLAFAEAPFKFANAR